MGIWKHDWSLEQIKKMESNTLVDHVGIEFIECGDRFIKARMPVDRRTIQPMGLLHGGASVVLAETLGSVASTMCLDDPLAQGAVGVEINANHLRSARQGYVYGTVHPIKIGRKIHVWRIVIEDEEGKQVCESRLTVAIIDMNKTKQ